MDPLLFPVGGMALEPTLLIRARFVVPVDAPPIENGGVLIRGGRILQVCPARSLNGDRTTDYGDAVICPGFVNAHTHLELTHLAGKVTAGPNFADWLFRLTERLRQHPLDECTVRAAVADGVAQSLTHGVSGIGDITRFPQWSRPAIEGSHLAAVSFGEVISIGSRRAENPAENLRGILSHETTRVRAHQSKGPLAKHGEVRAGLSPHSPYTVEPGMLRACAAAAEEAGARVCIHAAESPDEEQFTRTKTGPLADLLRALGVWDDQIPVAGCGPIELLLREGLLGPRTVLAHANYATEADLALLAESGTHVAYCPRTHAAFGHAPHPFRKMLAAGINVCIGTDSLASNPSLSVLDEIRFLHRAYPDFPEEELLAMATFRGAMALGLDDLCGSITPGKRAVLAVVGIDSFSGRWSETLSGVQPANAVPAVGLDAQ